MQQPPYRSWPRHVAAGVIYSVPFLTLCCSSSSSFVISINAYVNWRQSPPTITKLRSDIKGKPIYSKVSNLYLKCLIRLLYNKASVNHYSIDGFDMNGIIKSAIMTQNFIHQNGISYNLQSINYTISHCPFPLKLMSNKYYFRVAQKYFIQNFSIITNVTFHRCLRH